MTNLNEKIKEIEKEFWKEFGENCWSDPDSLAMDVSGEVVKFISSSIRKVVEELGSELPSKDDPMSREEIIKRIDGVVGRNT